MVRSRDVIAGLLAFSLYASASSAAVFRIDFYTEMTNALTDNGNGDVHLLRTSATGSFLYDDAVTGVGVFPDGNPVIQFKNEQFYNGVDVTDNLITYNPNMAPQDWVVGLDSVDVVSSGGSVTSFYLDAFWMGNSDPFLGSFDNPRFEILVYGPRDLGRLFISDPATGASWSAEHHLIPDTTVSWSYSEVPIPAAAWLFGSALIGLAGIKNESA